MAARKSNMAASLETREYNKPVDSSDCPTWIALCHVSKNTEYCPSSTVGNNVIKTCKNITKITKHTHKHHTHTHTDHTSSYMHLKCGGWGERKVCEKITTRYNQISRLNSFYTFFTYQKVVKL